MRQALRKKLENLRAKPSGHSNNTSLTNPSSFAAQQPTSNAAYTLQSIVAVPTLSPTEQLWNEAYDALKKDETKLMNAYEAILATELSESNPGDTIASDGSQRRAQMNAIIARSLAKTEIETTFKRTVGDIVQHLTAFRNIVGAGLMPSPEATLAWTALTVALPLFINAVEQNEKHRAGIAKVGEILVNADALAPYRLESDGLAQHILKPVLGSLYEKMLSFLIRAACHSSRSRIEVLLRDAIKFDDWFNGIKEIQEAENAVLKLDQDIKRQRTTQYQTAVLAEIRTEKDNACLTKIMTTDPRLDKKRIESIKGGLLRESYSWILGNDEFNSWKRDGGILYIRGDPGKGKTMLMCGIIDELVGSSAYFFCQAANKATNTGISVIRGLIYMLANDDPSLVALVRKRLDKTKDMFDANSWYLFSDILEDMIITDTYIVIDALDECIDGRQELIKFITRNRTKARWIVSSRNWSDIQDELRDVNSLSLEVNRSLVADAVSYYIRFKVDQLTKAKNYNSETQNFVLNYLQRHADDTFLWVALVCMNLENVKQRHVRSAIQSFPSGLQEVYQRMWQMVERKYDAELLKRILAVNAVVLRPITFIELQTILEMPEETLPCLDEVVQDCGSFLTIRNAAIEFVHQTAKEYIDRKTEDSESSLHLEVFSRSILAMSSLLKKDIYELDDPASSMAEICEPEVNVLASVRYSCLNWVPPCGSLWTCFSHRRVSHSTISDAALSSMA